jgi:histidinol phosphatase-like PHP family hydrolase
MNAITSDCHCHSRNSCDCKTPTIPTSMAETLAAMGSCGITNCGFTDHLHTPLNLPDLEASRREFDGLARDPRVHFGVEVSCVSAWELDLIAAGGHANAVYGLRTGGPAGADLAIGITEADIQRLGIEYVIGGAHWPMYVPFERHAIIADYHRQNMFLVSHPLVDIVAHPWWWMGHWQDPDGIYRTDPWLDDFGRVPSSMHDEFAAAAREHGTVVEINLHSMLLAANYPEAFRRRYVEYLAGLKAAGVSLAIGSDHHAQRSRYGDEPIRGEGPWRNVVFGAAIALLHAAGIHEDDLWCLP